MPTREVVDGCWLMHRSSGRAPGPDSGRALTPHVRQWSRRRAVRSSDVGGTSGPVMTGRASGTLASGHASAAHAADPGGRICSSHARLVVALVIALGGYLPAATATAPVAEAVGTTETGMWSVLGEYRVSPKPTSLTNRSREPIVAAHPYNALRLAVVYAAGPGEQSHPVIRISHDGGKTWRSIAGHPRGGGSHPMVAWGPGPTRGSARLWYTAMVGSTGQLPLRRELQRQRGHDLAPRLHRRQHARLVRRDGGHRGRHQPGEPQLRRDLPRLQLAEGPERRRRPARHRVAQLRPDVVRDRDPEGHAAQRLRRRLAHRLQARRPRPTARRTSRATSST